MNDLNGLVLTLFCGFVALTLAITYWAAKRTRTATEFFAAGRRIGGAQNGLALAGDTVSAGTLLGTVGLFFLVGFDAFFYMLPAMAGFFLLFMVAERLRNAGKFTLADVLAFRLRQRPVRAAAAGSTLVVVLFYLIAQTIGAGALIGALAGLDFTVAVVVGVALSIGYLVFGGMLGATWVQIIKAVFMIGMLVAFTVLVLAKVGFNTAELLDRARDNSSLGDAYLAPGTFVNGPYDMVSLSLAFCLGTVGLPHVLVRLFTVPDARTARTSAMWLLSLVGAVFLMSTILGFGARAILGAAGEERAGPGGNLALPLLAESLGGGQGSLGGDILFAVVGAVAFATILAVLVGLMIAASGAFAHDLWCGVLRKDASDREELRAGRITVVVLGIAIGIITIAIGPGVNIAFMTSLAFAVAASANFPTLVLALTWRGFTTAGAVTGIAAGAASAVLLIVLSPSVWSGESPIGWNLTNPAIASIPIGFLGCIVGSLLSRRAEPVSYDEVAVRVETGIAPAQPVR